MAAGGILHRRITRQRTLFSSPIIAPSDGALGSREFYAVVPGELTLGAAYGRTAASNSGSSVFCSIGSVGAAGSRGGFSYPHIININAESFLAPCAGLLTFSKLQRSFYTTT
jgi:hypothetical protein